MTSADEDAAAHGYLLPLIEFMAGDVGVLKTKSSYGLVIVIEVSKQAGMSDCKKKEIRARKNVLGKNEQATKE